MTRTAIPIDTAKLIDSPRSSQMTAAARAIVITTGTKTPLTLSASLAIGALEADASSTSRMICESVVSSPTSVASISTAPLLLTVAPMIFSPTVRSTGMLSPVIADSSKAALPCTITPSTGTLCPGLTRRRSPGRTSSTGISTNSSPRRTQAVFGARSISLAIASEVLPLERVSRYLPSVIKVRIIAEVSKYMSIAQL